MHSLAPLLVFADMGEVAVGPRLLSGLGQVIEVVLLVAGGKLHFIKRKHVEVFFRDEPRFVRAVDAAGEEEWFLVLLHQLVGNVVRDFGVTTELVIGDVEGVPVGFHILPWAAAR